MNCAITTPFVTAYTYRPLSICISILSLQLNKKYVGTPPVLRLDQATPPYVLVANRLPWEFRPRNRASVGLSFLPHLVFCEASVT
jgi:hypothetical protein